MYRPIKSNRQRAVTLVEILVAISLLGVVVVAISEYTGKLNSGIKTENTKSTMLNIAETIRLGLNNFDGIINSINLDARAGNSDLKNCIGPSQTCPAIATQENQQLGFYLWNNSSNPKPIAGPANAPVGYTKDGLLCTPGASDCMFGAVTYFWATCPRNAAGVPQNTCINPTTMNFRFQIIPLASANKKTELTGAQSFSAFPSDAMFRSDPTGFVIRMKTRDIVERIAQSCTNGTKQVGIQPDGRPKCECHSPAFDGAGNKRYTASGEPICADQRCSGNTDIMVGYYPDGRIKCINQNVCAAANPPPECPCHNVDLSREGECQTGYWLVHIAWGQCYATWSKGKGLGYETVVCEEHSGRCCKLDVQ